MSVLAFPMSLFAICPWRCHLSLDKDSLNCDKISVTRCLESQLNLWLMLAINQSLKLGVDRIIKSFLFVCKAPKEKKITVGMI